jgi:predicted nucleic acid-binding protein
MIVYLDASALVKRYVSEAGSREVDALLVPAAVAGTSVITRAEVAAALAKAMRVGLLTRDVATSAFQVFTVDWENLARLQMTEVLAARAATLAWEHGLRDYDAVHLAAALSWQEMLGEPVVLATFDRQLWQGAKTAGLRPWPEGQSN